MSSDLIYDEEKIMKPLEDIVIIPGGTSKSFVNKVHDSFLSYIDYISQDKSDNFKKRIESFKTGKLLGNISNTIFSDREMRPIINSDVAGKDVYLFHTFNFNHFPKSEEILRKILSLDNKKLQLDYLENLLDFSKNDSFAYSVNDGTIELISTLDAINRAGAKSITLNMPYVPFQRQDRKDKPRTPVTSKLFYSMIEEASSGKLKRIVALDLHAQQAQGFTSIPLDDLMSMHHFLSIFINKYGKENLIPIAPDAGAAKKTNLASELIDSSYCIVDKHRPSAGSSKVMYFMGNPENKIAIIIDDIISTSGSMINAAKQAKKYGAKKVYCVAPHFIGNKDKEGIFAEEKMEKAYKDGIIEGFYVSNTIPRNNSYYENKPWLKVVDMSHIFARYLLHRQLNLSGSKIVADMETAIKESKLHDNYLLNKAIQKEY